PRLGRRGPREVLQVLHRDRVVEREVEVGGRGLGRRQSRGHAHALESPDLEAVEVVLARARRGVARDAQALPVADEADRVSLADGVVGLRLDDRAERPAVEDDPACGRSRGAPSPPPPPPSPPPPPPPPPARDPQRKGPATGGPGAGARGHPGPPPDTRPD